VCCNTYPPPSTTSISWKPCWPVLQLYPTKRNFRFIIWRKRTSMMLQLGMPVHDVQYDDCNITCFGTSTSQSNWLWKSFSDSATDLTIVNCWHQRESIIARLRRLKLELVYYGPDISSFLVFAFLVRKRVNPSIPCKMIILADYFSGDKVEGTIWNNFTLFSFSNRMWIMYQDTMSEIRWDSLFLFYISDREFSETIVSQGDRVGSQPISS